MTDVPARDFAFPGSPAAVPGGADEAPTYAAGIDRSELEAPSILEQLAADAAAAIPAEEVTYKVPGRPGYTVRFLAQADLDDIKLWRKKAGAKKDEDPADPLKFACLVLGARNTAILKNGEALELGGQLLTFSSEDFLRTLGVGRVSDGVAKFYGASPFDHNDFAVTRTAEKVLRAAGASTDDLEGAVDDDDDLDPTT